MTIDTRIIEELNPTRGTTSVDTAGSPPEPVNRERASESAAVPRMVQVELIQMDQASSSQPTSVQESQQAGEESGGAPGNHGSGHGPQGNSSPDDGFSSDEDLGNGGAALSHSGAPVTSGGGRSNGGRGDGGRGKLIGKQPKS